MEDLAIWKSRAIKAEEELSQLRAEGEKSKPNLPQPVPVVLDPETTALLVLDLSNRCSNPAQVCSLLVPRIKEFLPKVRAAKVFTVYTIITGEVGTPLGKVWDGFDALPGDPVIAPDAFDKFMGGELYAVLQERGIKTVIITGAATNNAVLFTATSAAKVHKYNVVIPYDGVIANGKYESEYPFYQLSVMPGGANTLCSFTTLKGISFRHDASG